MKKVIILVFGILLLLLFSFFWIQRVSHQGIPQQSKVQELIPVKIGYMSFSSNWPVFLAAESNFFEKEGLKPELVQFSSGVDAVNALAKGDIVSMVVNPLTDLFNLEDRSPGLFKIYAMQQSTSSGNYTDTLLVKKDSSITSVKDLVGKKLGVNPGTFAKEMAKIMLEKNGVKNVDSVEFIQLTPNLHLQALQSGQIDAVIAYEPVTTQAITQGVAIVLKPHPFEDVMDPFPNVGFTISTKVVNENPDLAKRIIRVIEKAIIYGRSNPEIANRSASKYIKISEDILNKLRYPEQVLGKEIDKKRVQEVADLYAQRGLIPQKINTDDLFFIDESNQ